jgi:hypothetical protein
MKTSGESASETKVSAQLATKAITMPHIKELMFMTFTPSTDDVNP